MKFQLENGSVSPVYIIPPRNWWHFDSGEKVKGEEKVSVKGMTIVFWLSKRFIKSYKAFG